MVKWNKDIEKYIWGSVWNVINRYPQISEFYSPEDLFQEGVLIWLIVEKVADETKINNKKSYWSASYRNRILEILNKTYPLVSYDAKYIMSESTEGEFSYDWDDNLCSHFLDDHKRSLLNLIIMNTTEEERDNILCKRRWTIRRVRKRIGIPETFDENPRKKIYTTNPKKPYNM